MFQVVYSPICDVNADAYSQYIGACHEYFRLVSVAGGCACNNLFSEGKGVFFDSLDRDSSEFRRIGWRICDENGCVGGTRESGKSSCGSDTGECRRSEPCGIKESVVGGETGGNDQAKCRGGTVDADGIESSISDRVRVDAGGSSDDAGRSKGVTEKFVWADEVEDAVAADVSKNDDRSRKDGDKPVRFDSRLANVQCGPNIERNRRNRAERKARKQRRQKLDVDWRRGGGSVVSSFHDGVGSDARDSVLEKTELQKSSELKWKMQNELAAEKARRELEILKKTDLDKEYKRYNTKIQVATERNMVAIEKTHATLVASGNVPDAFHGSVHTVVDGEIVENVKEGGCTISPDSSASMAEYRIVQKKCLDLEAKLEKMAALTGISAEHVDDYDKRTWTDNAENDEKLDCMYPDGYGKTPHPFHENKFAVVQCSY